MKMRINSVSKKEVTDLVRKSLQEDIGSGDITASLSTNQLETQAQVISRENMILCGQPWVTEVYNQLDPNIRLIWLYADGDRIKENEVIFELHGPAQQILSGERCALNFLQTLSGTATTTNNYVTQLVNTDCKILDTRKTLPGLRLAQKYAVSCGGGINHRIGLFDAILIKENHIISGGGIKAIIRKSKSIYPDMDIEIEVETLDDLEEAIIAGADRLLLDNFSLSMLKRAYEINIKLSNPPKLLEASGNITIENIQEIANSGVDYISIGALTKNIKAIDLSMRFNLL